MARKNVLIGVFSLLILLVGFAIAQADWPTNGEIICDAASDQSYHKIVSDGSGGAVITWMDNRGGGWHIYAQRISADGIVQWTDDGVLICDGTKYNLFHQIATDGAGGAIITWEDDIGGSNNIFAQRIDASGTLLWASGGVTVCNEGSLQEHAHITTDGANGAIISWTDMRSGSSDIFAQRIDASGSVLWTINGVVVCDAVDRQWHSRLVSDDAGGAIICWQDARSTVDNDVDIYSQRVNAAGSPLWMDDGVLVYKSNGLLEEYATAHDLVTDGAGGAIYVWEDCDWDAGRDLWAQRLNANGNVMWTANGVFVYDRTRPEEEIWHSQIAPDGNGGVLIAWEAHYWHMDPDETYSANIIAQRVDAGGGLPWTLDGAVICTDLASQKQVSITACGSGGAIIAWRDERGANSDIYTQKVDPAGHTIWADDGIALCDASGNQGSPWLSSVSDGQTIAAWLDGRSGNADIYAQSLPCPIVPRPSLLLAEHMIRIEGRLNSSGNIHSNGSIAMFDVRYGCAHMGNITAVEDIIISHGDIVIGGDVLAGGDLSINGDVTVTGTAADHAAVTPVALPDFSYKAGKPNIKINPGESMSLAPGTYGNVHVKKDAELVLVNDGTTGEYVLKKLMVGKNSVLSVDVTHGPVVVNVAHDVMFKKYSEVKITPRGNTRALTINTLSHILMKKGSIVRGNFNAPYRDALLHSIALFHGSISAGSIEIINSPLILDHDSTPMPGFTSDGGREEPGLDTPATEPLEFTLFQNNPNPFNPVTQIRYVLPDEAFVRLSVYDVKGRLLEKLVARVEPAGEHSVEWHADAVASGIYFYRLQVGDFTETKKMILLK